MKSPLLVLHDAELTRLEGLLEGRIYDDVPENEVFPYITLGEMIARPWTDKFQPGQEVYSTKHIWSRYHGKAEVLQIADDITQALTKAPLDLGEEFHAVVDEMDETRVLDDIDGITRHGVLTFRYLIEEV